VRVEVGGLEVASAVVEDDERELLFWWEDRTWGFCASLSFPGVPFREKRGGVRSGHDKGAAVSSRLISR
jgi:hypothetical protein